MKRKKRTHVNTLPRSLLRSSLSKDPPHKRLMEIHNNKERYGSKAIDTILFLLALGAIFLLYTLLMFGYR